MGKRVQVGGGAPEESGRRVERIGPPDALDPCPFDEAGAHEIGVIVPGDDDHDVIFYCTRCATVKRTSVLPRRPLDDATADEIYRTVQAGFRR